MGGKFNTMCGNFNTLPRIILRGATWTVFCQKVERQRCHGVHPEFVCALPDSASERWRTEQRKIERPTSALQIASSPKSVAKTTSMSARIEHSLLLDQILVDSQSCGSHILGLAGFAFPPPWKSARVWQIFGRWLADIASKWCDVASYRDEKGDFQ